MSTKDDEPAKGLRAVKVPEYASMTGKAVVVATGVASGVALFRRASPPSSKSTLRSADKGSVKAPADRGKGENATELVAGMQPLLASWEQALSAADEAQRQLVALDPAGTFDACSLCRISCCWSSQV